MVTSLSTLSNGVLQALGRDAWVVFEGDNVEHGEHCGREKKNLALSNEHTCLFLALNRGSRTYMVHHAASAETTFKN